MITQERLDSLFETAVKVDAWECECDQMSDCVWCHATVDLVEDAIELVELARDGLRARQVRAALTKRIRPSVDRIARMLGGGELIEQQHARGEVTYWREYAEELEDERDMLADERAQ